MLWASSSGVAVYFSPAEMGRYRYLLVEPFFPVTLLSTLASARALCEHVRRSLVLPINFKCSSSIPTFSATAMECVFVVWMFSLKMVKDSSGLVRPRKREERNIRLRLFLIDSTRVSNWSRFTDKRWLLLLWFLILFSSNWPHPSTTASLMFLTIFKVFSNLKTWGYT